MMQQTFQVHVTTSTSLSSQHQAASASIKQSMQHPIVRQASHPHSTASKQNNPPKDMIKNTDLGKKLKFCDSTRKIWSGSMDIRKGSLPAFTSHVLNCCHAIVQRDAHWRFSPEIRTWHSGIIKNLSRKHRH